MNTENEILERLKSGIPLKYNTAVGSYVHDVLSPVAAELEAAHAEFNTQLDRIFVDSAEGTDLDDVLGQFGYTRKSATYASGYVVLTGASGASVSAGDLVAAGKVVYELQYDAVLTDGTVTVEIQAQSAGASGNADAGDVNYLPVTLENITSVTNPEPVTGGTDAESDEEFRERYYYFLDYPVTSGNKYQYEQWAREVDGVGYAKCYPIWNGGGTVKVVIATSELSAAGNALIEEVYNYIEERRPVGADVTVVSAEVVEITVTATVVHDASYSLTSISERYSEQLSEYFKEVGFIGGVLPYTKIGSILQELTGVEYYSNLLVNGGEANVEIPEGSLAVLGGVSLE